MNDNAFLLRREIRLRILKYLLNLDYDGKSAIVVDLKELSDFCRTNLNDSIRGLGDLGKGLRTERKLSLYTQLDPNSFNIIWRISEPSLKEVAAALEIAMTDGNCTSWEPQSRLGV